MEKGKVYFFFFLGFGFVFLLLGAYFKQNRDMSIFRNMLHFISSVNDLQMCKV